MLTGREVSRSQPTYVAAIEIAQVRVCNDLPIVGYLTLDSSKSQGRQSLVSFGVWDLSLGVGAVVAVVAACRLLNTTLRLPVGWAGAIPTHQAGLVVGLPTRRPTASITDG